MKSIFKELRRRQVFQTAALYVVAAWVIIQVAGEAQQAFELSGAALRYVWVAAFIGFPVALVFGWYYDITSDGIVHTPPAHLDADIDLSLNKTDYLIFFALLLVAVFIAYPFVGQVTKTQARDAETRVASELPINSIAVLPFNNLSSDPEQEYFSDGISEEILNRMIHLSGIRVISRNSSFAYKDSPVDIRDLGKRLGADYILQGSVRRASNVVRISVRLTDTSDGTEIWANSYDKKLANILSVQDEIAISAINEFAPSITFEPSIERDINAKAYEAYLRGNAYFNRGLGDPSIAIAAGLYERAVELDPTFVLSHVALAKAYSRMVIQGIDTTQERKDQARKSIETALQLDEDLPAVLAAQGWYYYWALADYGTALEWFELALEELPNDGELLLGLGLAERRLARWDDALRHLLLSFDLDPLSDEKAVEVGVSYAYKHEYSEAVAYFETAISLAPDQFRSYAHLAEVLIGRDQSLNGALQTLRKGSDVIGRNEFIRRMLSPQPPWIAQMLMLSAFPEEFKELELDTLTRVQVIYYLVLSAEQHRRDRRTDSKRATAETLLRLAGDIPDRFVQFVGLAYAHLDRREEAARLLTVSPESINSDARSYQEEVIIEAYGQLLLGNHDAAIARLDHALSTPGASSVAVILVSPLWDDLRYHAGFQSLIGKYEY